MDDGLWVRIALAIDPRALPPSNYGRTLPGAGAPSKSLAADVQVDRPLRTLTTLDRFGLVKWHGPEPTLRMLQVPELRRAMGFPDSFRLERGTCRDRTGCCRRLTIRHAPRVSPGIQLYGSSRRNDRRKCPHFRFSSAIYGASRPPRRQAAENAQENDAAPWRGSAGDQRLPRRASPCAPPAQPPNHTPPRPHRRQEDSRGRRG
jgi:hypothetical protein